MAQTQNLILRIVAQQEETSSEELLEVVQKFGRSPDAIRSAANRMVRAGLLTKTGQGRSDLRYSVGPQGQALIGQFIAKILRWHMALKGQLTWNGNWLVVTFSIPEEHRSQRDTFRTRLIEIGFGLLSSSVWISPLEQEADVLALVEELDLTGHVALLHCQRIQMPGVGSVSELAYRVWGLETLEAHYRDFNSRAEVLLKSLERVRFGEQIDTTAPFFEALDLQGELIDIILVEDPCLPAELLPPNWPGQRTEEVIHTLTRTVDQLDLADSRYHYLFHLIPGMEVLEAFRPEGDDSLHWPSERSGEP